MNIDQFEFYKLNNHKRQHSSEREREHENSDANSSVVVDLDSNCEQHAGSEIYLKCKLLFLFFVLYYILSLESSMFAKIDSFRCIRPICRLGYYVFQTGIEIYRLLM